MMFQFTHPGRGATGRYTKLSDDRVVSIHAPREGCDAWCSLLSNCYTKFQFTHPGRGATIISNVTATTFNVSIHAPREGCDK